MPTYPGGVGNGGDPAVLGRTALEDGEWDAALRWFRQIEEPGADVLEGLATAHWWRGEVLDAFAAWEGAYLAHVEAADVAAAFNVAIYLSLLHQANHGNRAASMGWASRAQRLVEGSDDPAVQGWLSLARATTAESPAEAVELGERARAAAASVGDRNLELCALATIGSGLVGVGAIDEGTRLLDEALAGALAGEGDLDTVVYASCLLMQTCASCADISRLVEWNVALQPFIDRYGCPYLNATCRAHHGAALFGSGRWAEAEAELRAAAALATRALPRVQAEAAAFLADLRLGQGRVDDARAALEGHEAQAATLPVRAELHLASGEWQLAVSLVRRHLDELPATGPSGVRMREVLASALIELGRLDEASEAVSEVTQLEEGEVHTLVSAKALRLHGRVQLASGDAAGAISRLTRASDVFGRLGLPYEEARTQAVLAQALDEGREAEAAVEEAQRGLRTLDRLGAGAAADALAAWLRQRGQAPRRSTPRGRDLLSAREAEVVAEVASGRTNPEIAERLYISRRTVEHHVSSALSKLGLRNRADLAAWSARQGEPVGE